MKAQNECLDCLLNQARATAKIAGKNQDECEAIACAIEPILLNLSGETPPEIAISVYAKISKLLDERDPYQEIKRRSILQAKKMVENLKYTDQNTSGNTGYGTDSLYPRLSWAIKVAVLGNVIDYGAQKSFSLKDECERIFETPFALDDFESFLPMLLKAKNIVYIGDNAGENIFDTVLLREMRRLNYKARISYFTRGQAIINDLTLNEARECGMDEVCELVDSGVPSPGFIYDLANKEAQRLYKESSLILAKGMGNFETLEAHKDERLFMLFKVKCDVVARHLGYPLGSFIFMQNLQK